MKKCRQCGKPAIAEVGNLPLCVDCLLKLQQAIGISANLKMQDLNSIADSIESIAGIKGIIPRYNTYQPVKHEHKVTFNNINVDNSVVGSINTGEIKRLDITMDHIKTQGNKELVTALKEFTEAVFAEASLDIAIKNQIIEQLSFLTSQSILPKEKRKSGIVKAVLLGLKDTVSTIASLVVLWGKLQPLLETISI